MQILKEKYVQNLFHLLNTESNCESFESLDIAAPPLLGTVTNISIMATE